MDVIFLSIFYQEAGWDRSIDQKKKGKALS
jgi:hypothetical protein